MRTDEQRIDTMPVQASLQYLAPTGPNRDVPWDGAGTWNQLGRPLGISAPTLGRRSSGESFPSSVSSSSRNCCFCFRIWSGMGSPPPPVDPSPRATAYGSCCCCCCCCCFSTSASLFAASSPSLAHLLDNVGCSARTRDDDGDDAAEEDDVADRHGDPENGRFWHKAQPLDGIVESLSGWKPQHGGDAANQQTSRSCIAPSLGGDGTAGVFMIAGALVYSSFLNLLPLVCFMDFLLRVLRREPGQGTATS
jgi:hypothetical protein